MSPTRPSGGAQRVYKFCAAAFLLVAPEQPAEMPPRHAQQLAGLLRRQPPLAVTLHRLFETYE